MEMGFDYCVANASLKRPRCRWGRGGGSNGSDFKYAIEVYGFKNKGVVK